MTRNVIAPHAVRAGLAALAGLALVSAAGATAPERARERVAYGDLDLTSEAGKATLDKRIRAAVKRVCNRDFGTGSDLIEWNKCKRESLAGANLQMDVVIARVGSARHGIAANTAQMSYPTGKR